MVTIQTFCTFDLIIRKIRFLNGSSVCEHLFLNTHNECRPSVVTEFEPVLFFLFPYFYPFVVFLCGRCEHLR